MIIFALFNKICYFWVLKQMGFAGGISLGGFELRMSGFDVFL
jgi:hypothetical protein